MGDNEVIPHATDKDSTKRDMQGAIRMAFNDADHTIGVNGFIVMAPGRKVTLTVATTNVAGDTEIFNFYEKQTVLLYTITVVYTDGTRQQLMSVERTA